MMNDAHECPTRAGDDTVPRYIAGTLPPAEVDHFEVHLLECSVCQAAVREGAALSAALRRPQPRMSWRYLLWGVPLAAAIAALLLVRPVNRVRSLGRVAAAPAFAGAPVRAAPTGPTALADSGMLAYGRGDWNAAVRLLGAADASGGGGPALSFYLGVARLMGGDPMAALFPLSRATAGPYAADAAYFRAKAFLRLGRADSALRLLGAASTDPVTGARARALADSVKAAVEK